MMSFSNFAAVVKNLVFRPENLHQLRDLMSHVTYRHLNILHRQKHLCMNGLGKSNL